MKTVEVAVGVIKREKKIYISKRHEKLHQGGLWEFPGGKREHGETIEEALYRELKEEIGIEVELQSPLLVIEHDYGDKKVRLDVRLIEVFSGEPAQQENQLAQWVEIERLLDYSFPQANIAIINALLAKVD